MENKEFNNLIRERTFKLALKIVKLTSARKTSLTERPPVNQLIRSSTSMAANWRAAIRARSDRDFYSKVCIVLEECDETLFWIEFLIEMKFFYSSETDQILSEIEELFKIFTSMRYKLRTKHFT